MPSLSELADEGDSILTTDTACTSETVVKHTKMGRPATKGRKTRAKKGEPIEVVHAEPDEHDVEMVDSAPKKTRGSKRKSEHMEDSIEQPPPKKRPTRTRGTGPKAEKTNSAPKKTRGSKRKSEDMEDNIELLPPKRRTTRAQEAELMNEEVDPVPAKAKRSKRSNSNVDEDIEQPPPEELTEQLQAAEPRVEM